MPGRVPRPLSRRAHTCPARFHTLQASGFGAASISFAPNLGSATTAVTLGFQSNYALSANAVVVFALPRFSRGGAHAALGGYLGSSPVGAILAGGSSWEEVPKQLSLLVGPSGIARDEEISVTIGIGAGIRLPPSLAAGQPLLTIEVVDAATPIPASAVQTVPPVSEAGALSDTGLSYSPAGEARPGEPVAIGLRFGFDKVLEAGAAVKASLPAFEGPDDAATPMECAPVNGASLFDGAKSTWDQAARTLRLVVARRVMLHSVRHVATARPTLPHCPTPRPAPAYHRAGDMRAVTTCAWV